MTLKYVYLHKIQYETMKNGQSSLTQIVRVYSKVCLDRLVHPYFYFQMKVANTICTDMHVL